MKSTRIERNLSWHLFLLGVLGLMTSSGVWAQEQSWSYAYNDQGLITLEDGPRTDVDDTTTHTYDSRGNRLSTTNALGHATTYSDHDASGRVLSVTDSNGLTTELAYHSRGWLTRSTVKTPEGPDQVTEYDYDAVGQLVGMTLPNGATMHFDYDAARRLVGVSNGQGERIEYTLDAAGNRTQETILDSTGTLRYSVSRAYDELSRIMDILGNNDQHEHRDYDVNDNPTVITDGRTHTTEQQYDALDRVSQVFDPALGETHYTYNSQDQINSVTDPAGLTTHYRYDGLGNLVEVTSPDTGTTTHEYDAAGNRTRTTDNQGVVSEYSYDALNRLVAAHYPDQPEYNVQYHYDETENGNHGIGRLTGLTDASGHTAYRYDPLGQVIEKQTTVENLTLTVQYQYDLMGRVSGITYPSGRQIEIERDPQGRPDRILAQPTAGAALQPLMEQARYLPFGPIKEYTYGNGLIHQRAYDQDYRLTQLDVGSSHPVLSRLYEYDLVNNITGIHSAQSSGESESFTYDALNRLTDALRQEGLLSYSYDSVGNRTERYRDGDIETYLYGPDSHQLEARDNTQYQYDAAGNTLDNGTYRFRYGANNRLVEVQNQNGFVAEYRHNALGQRVYKRAGQATPDSLALAQENDQRTEAVEALAQKYLQQAEGTTSADAQQTVYVYNETGQLIGEYDDTGAATREYIYRDTTPLALAINDQIYYYHNDHLATPKLLTDANQNIVWQAKHTPFGKAEIQIEQVTNNLRFPGQYFDEETGLHYNYFRDYDPETGRYLQSDPIGLKGGLNTYAYVEANPLSFVDPLGLARWQGRIESISYGRFGYGGTKGQIIVKSDCVDGKQWYVWARFRGQGGSAGPVVSASASRIELNDPYESADPINLTGNFTMASSGFSTPLGGATASMIQAGMASSDGLSFSFGLSMGWEDIHGSIDIEKAKELLCECE